VLLCCDSSYGLAVRIGTLAAFLAIACILLANTFWALALVRKLPDSAGEEESRHSLRIVSRRLWLLLLGVWAAVPVGMAVFPTPTVTCGKLPYPISGSNLQILRCARYEGGEIQVEISLRLGPWRSEYQTVECEVRQVSLAVAGSSYSLTELLSDIFATRSQVPGDYRFSLITDSAVPEVAKGALLGTLDLTFRSPVTRGFFETRMKCHHARVEIDLPVELPP
jgi:hypothetical protein